MLNKSILNKNKIIVALFLNGELPNTPPCLSNYYKIFAVDGAYNYLYKHNIIPDIVLGDMDSIYNVDDNSQSLFIKTMNQNFTDFEKTLQFIIKNNFVNIDVFGAIGGHFQDHFMGNLFVSLKYINTVSLVFYDKEFYIFYINKSVKIYNVKNKIISIFPFSRVINIVSQGLKYELLHANLTLGQNMGIRNIAKCKNINLFFRKGILLIFVQQ